MAKPAAEWICAAIGLVVTGTTFVVVAHDLGGAPEQAPMIELAVDGIIDQGEGYVVTFSARNVSEATAAAYRVEGVLTRNGAVVERSDVTFDYVPRGSTETGGVWFTHNPAEFDLKLRSLGYQQP
ncbi:MAG TPA: hypothetical protein VGN98_04160 [Tianweitania sediminis]|jgi:uncharacterized protein (TIGR02588 family)|nr:hypothetical protein [Tianweitania sediminis]